VSYEHRVQATSSADLEQLCRRAGQFLCQCGQFFRQPHLNRNDSARIAIASQQHSLAINYCHAKGNKPTFTNFRLSADKPSSPTDF
jgi:hypothetical protein